MRDGTWKMAAAVVGGVLFLAGCGSPSTTPATPHRQSLVAAGRTLYEANCQSCHGAQARGGIAVGAATSADIRWSTLKTSYTVPLLKRAILQGLDEHGRPLDPAMPRWKGHLTDRQVEEIIAYLKTL